MHELTDQAQEILENLWIQINEKNNIPDTSLMRNNEAFKELIKYGYIQTVKEKLLTSKGIDEARLCVRRHRLAERLLTDVFQLKGNIVHETGCKLEHILSKGLEDTICTLLGHPKACPHGSPIPSGKCCIKMKSSLDSLILPLSKIKKNYKGKIAYLNTNNDSILKKLLAMGVLPGLTIILKQKFPAFIFKIGESEFAVDKNIADNIYVSNN